MVARADGALSFLHRDGDVARIGGPEEERGREQAEAMRSVAEKGVIHWMPRPQAAGAIGFELVAAQFEATFVHDALAEFPMKDRNDFRFANELATHFSLAVGKGNDVRAVRFGEVKFRSVTGGELDHRPSCIWEMI
jgi:hypothetical protein